jgi:hypothetical protein
MARGEGVGGSVDGGIREAGGGGESQGAEDGGAAEGAVREDDGGGDEKVAKCWSGRVTAFIYRHPFSPRSCNEP